MPPSVATLKRLFAKSRNRCAFPRCANPLIHEESGKVTGRVCHIRARSADGPRFDSSQTSDERDDYPNLLLMCPIHHDVVDADPESYTIARLEQIKKEHEQAVVGSDTRSDLQESFVRGIAVIQEVSAATLTSQGQSGGQFAASILNVGEPAQPSWADRKASKIREWQGKTVTIAHMNTGRQAMLAGAVRGFGEGVILYSDDFSVTLKMGDAVNSISLARIEISRDHQRDRPQLEVRPSN